MKDFRFSGLGGSITVHGDFRRHMPAKGSYVLVRCWGKTVDDIRNLWGRLVCIRNHFAFDCVLVVIDKDKDDGKTFQSIEVFDRLHPGFFIPVLVSGPADIPNWTRLLNAGLKFLHDEGVAGGKLLCMSFETEIADRHLLKDLPDGCMPVITLRATPAVLAPGEVNFLLAGDACGMHQHVVDVINACKVFIIEGNEVPDVSYKCLMALCRNTLQVWDIGSLYEMRGFDSRCNLSGGQEDSDMLLRMSLYHSSVIPEHAPVLRYEDMRFRDLSPQALVGHAQKIARELQSLHSILWRLRETDDFNVFPMDFEW